MYTASPASGIPPRASAPSVSEDLDFDFKYPPLPRTIAEVSRLMQAEEPDSQALARVVAADPAVAAILLRRINSVYYALSGRISDVPRAVTMLGFRETCHAALTAGLTQLRDVLSTPEQAVVYRELVWRSLGAAFYTHELAVHTRLAPAPFAFTVGLLSTAGQLVLLYNKKQDYPALWEKNGVFEAPTSEEEREAFGVGHPELGAQAARHWNLPLEIGSVLEAVDLLERATPELRPLALALNVAQAATAQLERAEGPHEAATFNVPEALGQLASCTETAPEALVALVEKERDRVRTFIAAMSA